jgi:hypothetical protein
VDSFEIDAEDDTEDGANEGTEYKEQLREAINQLYNNRKQYLSKDGLRICSPKFLAILNAIQDPKNKGLHLLYTQFRETEGIEVFKYVMETNGMEAFTVAKDAEGVWQTSTLTPGKSRFLLFTGTETVEEKEILLNVYNGHWNAVPKKIVESITSIGPNNLYGEIVKVFMITSSGAEGISLRNTRFVHVVEPYWHFVRIEQVVGRARRICSHQDLPEELRTVQVFIYLSVLSENQLQRNKTGLGNKQMELRDVSKRQKDGAGQLKTFTTDETLFELAQIKDENNQILLNAMKEAAMDCALYNNKGNKGNEGSNGNKGSKDEGKEERHCFSFAQAEPQDMAFHPSVDEDLTEVSDVVEIVKKMNKLPYRGMQYRIDTSDPAQKRSGKYTLYDDAEYMKGKLKGVGFAVQDKVTNKLEVFV